MTVSLVHQSNFGFPLQASGLVALIVRLPLQKNTLTLVTDLWGLFAISINFERPSEWIRRVRWIGPIGLSHRGPSGGAISRSKRTSKASKAFEMYSNF